MYAPVEHAGNGVRKQNERNGNMENKNAVLHTGIVVILIKVAK